MHEAEVRKQRTKTSVSQAHDSLYLAPALDFTLTRWEVLLLRILPMLSGNIWSGGELGANSFSRHSDPPS